MIMNIVLAPIIHAKTLNMDFRSNLLTVPNDFTEEKIAWAREHILSSMQYMEKLDSGYRKVVFSDGKHCIIGIAAVIKTLYRLCERQIDEVRDCCMSPVYAFIGFAFKVSEVPGKENIDIPLYIYMNAYLEHVMPRWREETYGENALKPYTARYRGHFIRKGEGDADKDLSIEGGKIVAENMLEDGSKMIVENTPEINELAYKFVMKRVLDGEGISFCTKLPDAKAAADSPFRVVTCSNSSGN